MDPIYGMSDQDKTGEQPLNGRKAAGTAHLGSSVSWLAASRGPRVVFAPEGLADITAAAPATPETPATPPVPPVTPEKPEAPVKAERPDWLPESLWDGDKGFKKDDFDALVASKAERDSALASVPETPDAYQVKLPTDFKLPDGMKMPEGGDIIDTADPRVVALRDLAHSEQWSQTQFEKVLAFGVNMDLANEANLQSALKEQVEKLGSRGAERIKAVTTWLDAKLGAGPARELYHMMYTSSQMESFERLMQLFKGDIRGNPNGGRDNNSKELSDEDYDKMTPTQKINYARQAQSGR